MLDICIAGDMIVGFSGETEDNFKRSLDLLRHAKYKNCFIFKYSPRPGTVAYKRLPDDVPDEIKRRRNNEMLALQAEINLQNHQAMLEQTVEVLVEGPSKSAIKAQTSEQSRGEEAEEPGALRNQVVGRTAGDQIVVLPGRPDMIGRFVRVRITSATSYTLYGEAVEGRDAVLHQRRDIPLTTLNP